LPIFRIRENFSDGVKITREKWASGKSAYIMTKDGKEIFSTIENGVYIPFKGVPEAIQRYLNLVDDSNINLHLRRGRDDLLLVDTTGRENYQFLSAALKAEEISNASAMLKTDRLAVKSDVSAIEYAIEGYRSLVSKDKVVTTSLVDYLEEVDKRLEKNEDKKRRLDALFGLIEDYRKIKPSVTLQGIETDKVRRLQNLFSTIEDYNKVNVTMNLDKVDSSRVVKLNKVLNNIQEYNKNKPLPTLNGVDLDRFNKLMAIGKTLEQLHATENKIQDNIDKIREHKAQVTQIEEWLQENKVQAIRCKN